METKYKITIPKPCHEDWNTMTPDETGRFCSSCVKSVVDFTAMKAPEIQEYFSKNQGQKICGRFKTEQLDTIIIQIPRDVLFSQLSFHKMFMLALLVSMGTTLLSCHNANGYKQAIDKVEVVDSLQENTTMGLRLPPKDSLKITSPTPTSIYETKAKKSDSKGSFLTGFSITKPVVDSLTGGDVEVKTNKPPQIIEEDKFMSGMPGLTIYPEYKGGKEKFNDFIKLNYKFPKNANKINGRLKASFTIEKDGTINEITSINDLGYGSGQELSRVLSTSAKWYPAEYNGKKQPFHFELSLLISSDTVSRIFDKKITAKIDSIELIRITKFDH